jgi:hypothetical protein
LIQRNTLTAAKYRSVGLERKKVWCFINSHNVDKPFQQNSVSDLILEQKLLIILK